jgi:hypothetical protein
LAWGYADQSFRLGNYESDKAVFVCEPNYLVGQVNVKTRDGTIYLWSLHARDQYLA